MADREPEKTCQDCKCRNCYPITAMAERLDAYSSAQSLLAKVDWPEDTKPAPHEYLLLANWLYYGEGSGDD